ncbi:hypothetical protein XH86_33305 [Bradyrhizobium guangdongense]|uniref:Uncharacterized protein n=1 Tax=Bradyrhizobium guangdongense TaxID=1325090 RepID=A0ABX6UNU3_9BRAD|nr:hypothetical protein X265_33270 [Bradyrhizobium guangdongense]QOZ63071.1 hypothetical protein XH86_33305 [Bradyrhizobium guangdongense]
MKAAAASSLRAQRRNPESSAGKILDCFAALAMTENLARSAHHSPPQPSKPSDPAPGRLRPTAPHHRLTS